MKVGRSRGVKGRQGNEPQSKVGREIGESKGFVFRDVVVGSAFRHKQEMVLDSIDEVEWLGTKE